MTKKEQKESNRKAMAKKTRWEQQRRGNYKKQH